MVEAVANMQAHEPSLSTDGRTLYFTLSSNLYVMRRADRDAAWDPALSLEANISTGNEGRLTTSGDEMFAVFVSARDGNVDLWSTKRTTPNGNFQMPAQSYVDALRSSSVNDLDPELSGDALRLYYAPYDGNQTIVVASRATRSDPFARPVTLSELQISSAVGDPTLSPDELVIAFSSGATIEENDIYFAVRPDRSSPFRSIAKVPGVNIDSVGEWDVELSSDGCEMYFVSDRSGATELYSVQVQ
jgi:Tol biopolymer transport system component